MTILFTNGQPAHERYIAHRNRLKASQPDKAKFWCHGCDKAMVGQCGMCLVCRRRMADGKGKYKQ